MRTISFRQQALLKEAGPKERKRSSGLNFDFAQSELGRSGFEVSRDVIQKYLEENKDKLPISDSDLIKINDLNLNESARKRVNEEEAFFLIIGAVKSGDNETESIRSISEYLERVELKPGDLKTNWMLSVNLLDLNSIVAAWNDFYSEVKREKEEVKRKELESKEEDYISNEVVYDDFGDGWRVVYVPALGEIEEYPGLKNTSHDRILEGNKNGLCLGSGLKFYQDNREGEIFSVRDPNNKPEVTIRIAGNVLQEAKGKQNLSPSIEGAAHAIKWFETIEGLNYQNSRDYKNFPPLSAEEARNKFLSYPNDSYERGWISSWYGKGISEIDEHVQRRIAGNDPLVFALAEKHHKLIKPVVQFWFKELGEKFDEIVCSQIINHNLHKLYKDLPEIIEFGRSVADNLPLDFLNRFASNPWAKDYIPTAANNYAEKNPYGFLSNFRSQPWAEPYLPTAAKNYAERHPYNFLKLYKNEPWAQTYLPIVAKSFINNDPAYFLINFINEPWAQEHIPAVAESLAKKHPSSFLNNFINDPWAKEHIPTAAKSLAERDPYSFLSNFRSRPWAEPYLQTTAKNCAEKYPEYFLSSFANQDWAKPYIFLAGKNLAEIDPDCFLSYFINASWAKEPREDLGGKSLVQYAKEIIKKQSSYSPKLIKLAKVLRSFGLSKEASEVSQLPIFSDSKVRDSSGNLIPLYHGTSGEFSFDRLRQSKDGALGSGIYLTPIKDFAKQYGDRLIQVYANLTNPIIIDTTDGKDPCVSAFVLLGMDENKATRKVEKAYDDFGYVSSGIKSLGQKLGYDGIMQYKDNELSEVVVWDKLKLIEIKQ